jgi:hypothetical protein
MQLSLLNSGGTAPQLHKSGGPQPAGLPVRLLNTSWRPTYGFGLGVPPHLWSARLLRQTRSSLGKRGALLQRDRASRCEHNTVKSSCNTICQTAALAGKLGLCQSQRPRPPARFLVTFWYSHFFLVQLLHCQSGHATLLPSVLVLGDVIIMLCAWSGTSCSTLMS